MKAPSTYRKAIQRWEHWLKANHDAKPNHRAIVGRIIAAYRSVLPEAEEAFAALQAKQDEIRHWLRCENCGEVFGSPRRHTKSCSPRCRKALARSKPRKRSVTKARSAA